MRHPRISRALTLLGAALLLASIVAPWVTLYITARSDNQQYSPASILWYALTSTPYSFNGAASVTLSLVYIGVTLAFVVAVVALTRASWRPSKRFATAALVALFALVPYFVGTSLLGLTGPIILEMTDSRAIGSQAVGVGMACVIIGGLCAIIGLTDMAR